MFTAGNLVSAGTFLEFFIVIQQVNYIYIYIYIYIYREREREREETKAFKMFQTM